MDTELYDEFGNYIGPELDSSDEENPRPAEEEEEEDKASAGSASDEEKADPGGAAPPTRRSADRELIPKENAIVLQEDKQYYPDAEEVYPGVETIVQDEDTQDLTEPIIKPLRPKTFSVLEKEVPKTTYTAEFLTSLMGDSTNIRNISVIGGLHSGKTSLLDMLIEETRQVPWDVKKEIKYTDTRKDEHERGVSICSTPISLVLPSISNKHHLINFIDVPGHVDFIGEVSAAVRPSQGALVVVDAVEGVGMLTKKHIEAAVREGLQLILVINKMDKFILDLRLPISEVYYKLMHLLEEANAALKEFDPTNQCTPFHPLYGNTIFACPKHRWAFTIQSYVHLYESKFAFESSQFIKYCWGNFYLDPRTRAFVSTPPFEGCERVFSQFFLEPMWGRASRLTIGRYKVYTQAVGEEPASLARVFRELKIRFKKSDLHLDVDPLLRMSMGQFFDHNRGVVDSILSHVSSPMEGATNKVSRTYTGDRSTGIVSSMNKCDAKGPLMIQVCKLYPDQEGRDFLAFGSILSGTIKVGQEVRVLGHQYSLDDTEDQATMTVSALYVSQARYNLPVDRAPAGNWILIEGVSSTISETATITGEECEEAEVFTRLTYLGYPTVKVSIEALKPSDVPKMEHGIRCLCKSYPLMAQRVEESGEHVLVGTGEMQLDCALYDLRYFYGDLEVKVANPIVAFCETVSDTSSLNCFVETPNKANRIMMIAEPLDQGLAEDIEARKILLSTGPEVVSTFFEGKYQWDPLSSRSVWAFGPEENGPNVLCDDTIPGEVDSALLGDVRENIVQGFKWACKEGPLCDEPIRNVKFKIMGATISQDRIQRGAGQVIPTARRLVYGSFLMATPRLMEPISVAEIVCPADLVKEVFVVLQERRGHGTSDVPKPGSPFFYILAFIPTIESFGFETDLRIHTQGLAFCQMMFHHWETVSSDPFDEHAVLHPIEPADPQALAKDFMLKTRRRKGLAEEVNIRRYFDEAMLEELARSEALLNS